METVAEPGAVQEQAKSFDVLASIKLYRHDLANYGQILPETRQRVYDEELSYVAEGINRPNAKEFILEEMGGELVYFHAGEWRPYIGMLIVGLQTAQAEAAADPRKTFEQERREADLATGYHLSKLRPGDRLHWYYDFPQSAHDEYGPEFLQTMGFQPERRMGFLFEAERLGDGRLAMRHQSVDNSHPLAFTASMRAAMDGGDIEDMLAAYDAVHESLSGEAHYAGRPTGDQPPEEEAWSVIDRNRDLIDDYFMGQLESLATSTLNSEQLVTAKKRLTYGVWAALRERLENSVALGGYDSGRSISAEVSAAYDTLSSRGEQLFGCGGSITGEQALLGASAESVFDTIFNKKQRMTCPFCGASVFGDPCASSQYCPACTAKVVNGKVVSKGNSQRRRSDWVDELFGWVGEDLSRIDCEKAAKSVKA